MDYHRYNGVGVGSVPLIPGGQVSLGLNGLSEQTIVHGASPLASAPSISGFQSNLLTSHHPSMMLHYGVSGKPQSIPPHLFPPRVSSSVSLSSNLSLPTNCIPNTIYSNANGSSLVNSKAPDNLGTNVTSIPTLCVNSHYTSHSSDLSPGRTSPNSSFAAALKSLAKQATVPTSSEVMEHRSGDYLSHKPLKTVPPLPTSLNNGPAGLNSETSVALVSTTTTHWPIHDLRTAEAYSEMDHSVVDPMKGFQPYRSPDVPAVSGSNMSAQQPLRPPLPLDIVHSYQSQSTLFSHPLTQYRLEEQLYLEHYGLLRPPLSSYPVGCLPSLYPNVTSTSPYLSSRFPQDFLSKSMANLHPSSALVHERLKLEGDIRQREYELGLRRDKERTRERDRFREKEREREKEPERKLKASHRSDKVKGGNNLIHLCDLEPKPTSTSDGSSKFSVTQPNDLACPLPVTKSEPLVLEPVKSKLCTIVRPFESNGTTTTNIQTSSAIPHQLSIERFVGELSSEEKNDLTSENVSSKDLSKSAHKPFSVWHPVDLNISSNGRSDSVPSTVLINQVQISSCNNDISVNKEKPVCTQMLREAASSITSNVISSPVLLSSHSSQDSLPRSAPCSQMNLSPYNLPTFHSHTFKSETSNASPQIKPRGKVLPSVSVSSNSLTNQDIPSGCTSVSSSVIHLSSPSQFPTETTYTNSASIPSIPLVSTFVRNLSMISSDTSCNTLSPSQCVSDECTQIDISVKEEVLASLDVKKEHFCEVLSPVSRLDNEEKRLKELLDSGMLPADAEEIIFEEFQSRSINSCDRLCTKGPPTPFEASSEKLTFLGIVGLTTHDEANRVELDRFERRAKVLTPLSDASYEPCASNGFLLSSKALNPMLAPGQNLCTFKRRASPSSLVDFSNKYQFLHCLGLHAVKSVVKRNDIERVWRLVAEDRLRRYLLDDSEDGFTINICHGLRRLLEVLDQGLADAAAFSKLNGESIAQDNSLADAKPSVLLPGMPYSCGLLDALNRLESTTSSLLEYPNVSLNFSSADVDKSDTSKVNLSEENMEVDVDQSRFPNFDPLIKPIPSLKQVIESVLQTSQG